MAKRGIELKDGIPVRCDYCKHNLGVNQQFGYMWHCSHLSFCVVFGLQYCKAKKDMKGDFDVDKIMYEEWKKSNLEK